MSVAHELESLEQSPLAGARLQRKLTVEECARRAGISAEQVEWLEAGRVYRFPTPDDALVATILYGATPGIDSYQAPPLARLPGAARPGRSSRGRIAGAAGAAGLLAAPPAGPL